LKQQALVKPFTLFLTLLCFIGYFQLNCAAQNKPAKPARVSFLLGDQDRVVFYGDSITAQRYYTRYVEEFLLTRYPALHVSFFNAGVPGDTVYGGYTGDIQKRLNRDVLPFKPTFITVMLGMNDPGYVPFDAHIFDVFQKGYKTLLNDLAARLPQAKITLISSSPYDELTHGTEFPGLSSTVQRYGQFVKDLAVERGDTFVDFNDALGTVMQTAAKDNSDYAALLIPDRIHPSESFHWVMAEELMNTWQADPEVSSVELDAQSVTVVVSRNADISNLQHAGSELRWTVLEHALPLPLSLGNPMMAFVIRVGHLESMDMEMLRVRGLSTGRYSLEIDGKAIGDFSAEQLNAGLNLALLRTPMLDQARGVDWTEERKMKMDAARFTLEAEMPDTAASLEAVKTLRAAIDTLSAESHQQALPKPHTFALVAK
jgi:lysophospholipase L1-like esterase